MQRGRADTLTALVNRLDGFSDTAAEADVRVASKAEAQDFYRCHSVPRVRYGD